jgi:hypothetical protein
LGSRGFACPDKAHSARMVNAGFPDGGWYGFKMVDMENASVVARDTSHQSKIYGESNRSNFWWIFGDLTSMQTLALYRRLLVRG